MKELTVIYSKPKSDKEKSKGFNDFSKASDFGAEILRDGGKILGLLNRTGKPASIWPQFEVSVKQKYQKLISN